MSLDFKWLDGPIEVDVVDKLLTTKPKTYYRKCHYQGVEYTMGDHVLIANSEAQDPESLAKCYVASIVYMYEMRSNKKDPYRAQVQWYSRVEQLPKKLLASLSVEPALDEAWEVVHEGQRYKGDLSIETIFGKCSVLNCPEDQVPSKLVGRQKKSWVFFCRFALAPKNSRSLIPFKEYSELMDREVAIKIANSSEPEPGASTPARITRSGRKSISVVPENEDTNNNTPSRPKSRSSARKIIEDPLPSPLKNSTFSVSATKELRIVIQRCPKLELSEPKAKKKLDLGSHKTPPKEEEPKTPSRKRAGSSTPKGSASAAKKKLKMTPRSGKVAEATSPLGEIRRKLHVSAVLDTLPCREDEFQHIFNFVEGKLTDGTGGCMYISGVPGTGKTATTNEVVRMLRESQEEGALPDFKLVMVNGMKMTTPQQIYVQIWNQLTNSDGEGASKVTVDKALKLLQSRFSANGPRHLPTVLIVDELDLLWTRQQDVLYNVFEWPNRPKAQLTVLAIANTMDLPERMLMNRVASRMGLTRLTFQPYKVKQLQTIISSRLENLVSFEPEAVEFIARKVSAASGDARRALDISRRAAELAEMSAASKSKGAPKSSVTMVHVQQAIEEMFSSPKFLAIQACSLQEQMFLNAIVQEFYRTGVEESIFQQVIRQHYTLCDLEGMSRPNVSELLSVCASLSSSRLILSEHGRQDIRMKVRLNLSMDDVAYALKAH